MPWNIAGRRNVNGFLEHLEVRRDKICAEKRYSYADGGRINTV